MPIVRLIVETDFPDSLIQSLPFSVRREYSEIAGFEKEQVTGGGAIAIPTSHIGTPGVTVISSDTVVTVALGNITLSAGGFIIVVDGVPATNPPTVDNAGGSTAKIRGVVAGS